MDLAVSTIADAKASATAYFYTKASQLLNRADTRLRRYRRFLSAEAFNYLALKVSKLASALDNWADSSDRSAMKVKLISNLIKLLKKQLTVVFSRIQYIVMCHKRKRRWHKVCLSDILIWHTLPE